jgi:hypothetical protein
MKPSVGLLALWTGQASANMDHMQDMCIHEMSADELDRFAVFVRQAKHAIEAIDKYVNDKREAA